MICLLDRLRRIFMRKFIFDLLYNPYPNSLMSRLSLGPTMSDGEFGRRANFALLDGKPGLLCHICLKNALDLGFPSLIPYLCCPRLSTSLCMACPLTSYNANNMRDADESASFGCIMARRQDCFPFYLSPCL